MPGVLHDCQCMPNDRTCPAQQEDQVEACGQARGGRSSPPPNRQFDNKLEYLAGLVHALDLSVLTRPLTYLKTLQVGSSFTLARFGCFDQTYMLHPSEVCLA